jgi:thioredoxin 1
MGELLTLTDANIESVLNDGKPALLLFTNGEGLRGDFKVAFRKLAAEENRIVFAEIDPAKNVNAAARFSIGDKPTLIGYVNGEEVIRRSRPWGTDLPLALEMLRNAQAANPAEIVDEPQEEKPAVNTFDTPVVVTDATFEQEVLESDMPVLVDFWAPWCGPCRMVAPILDKLAKEFAGQIKITKVNVDENPGLSQVFQIRSIPTLMIVKERTIIFSQPGALPEPTMRDLVQQAIKVEVPKRDEAPAAEAENAGD